MQPQSSLNFWFTELTPKQHFAKDAALDETIRTLRFELLHKAIIDRFGRYPHPHSQRCAILGRSATAEELAVLSGPGSSF